MTSYFEHLELSSFLSLGPTFETNSRPPSSPSRPKFRAGGREAKHAARGGAPGIDRMDGAKRRFDLGEWTGRMVWLTGEWVVPRWNQQGCCVRGLEGFCLRVLEGVYPTTCQGYRSARKLHELQPGTRV